MALGSQRSGILRLILLSAVKLALAGCVIGLLATAAASRLLNSLLFAVSPFDPLVLSLAAAFVIVLVLAASLLPATRAASTNPVHALRAD
jgi:ABC-type antimicrobial peptide transport system permease subunit